MGLTSRLANRISNYENPASLGSRFRARRARILVEMMERVHRDRGRVRILDVGGTEAYWGIIPTDTLDRLEAEVTILNLPGSHTAAHNMRFSHVEGDGCEMGSFRDGEFDIAHSNSVIEHVGDWHRMSRFAAEVSRVGRGYFVQTPNFWFPLEPHAMTPFFHWLPEPVRVAAVRRAKLGNWQKAVDVSQAVEIVESARLLDRKMLQALFPDADVMTERVLGLAKSLVAIRRERP